MTHKTKNEKLSIQLLNGLIHIFKLLDGVCDVRFMGSEFLKKRKDPPKSMLLLFFFFLNLILFVFNGFLLVFKG